MADDSFPHFDLSDAAARVFCRGCGGAYVREVGQCSSCGSEEFVTREEARELESAREIPPPEPIPEGGVELAVTEDIVEEGAVRSALEDAGIAYANGSGPMLLGSTRGSYGEVSFYVSGNDLERAKEAIDGIEALARAAGTGEHWREDWRERRAGDDGPWPDGARRGDAGGGAELHAATAWDAESSGAAWSGGDPPNTAPRDGPAEREGDHGREEWGLEEWSMGERGADEWPPPPGRKVRFGGLSDPDLWFSPMARLLWGVVLLALMLVYCARWSH